MQITGTITNAQPPDYVDQHQNKYQNIVITDGAGTRFTGRIASKRGYNGGEELTVTSTSEIKDDGSTWTRFKRFNPQQQGPQNAQQGASRGQQATKPDWDAIAQGKCRHGLVCAYIGAGVEPNINLVNYWLEFIMTGKAPLPPAMKQQSKLDTAEQQIEQDDIPWEQS